MMLDVTDIDDFMVLANSLYGILQAQSNINFLMIVLQASMWIDYKIKSQKVLPLQVSTEAQNMRNLCDKE